MASHLAEYFSPTDVPGGGFMTRLVRLLKGRLRTRRPSPNKDAYDPMSHPDIMRMSLHQLADLPFTTPDGYRDKHRAADGSGGDTAQGLRGISVTVHETE